MDWTDPYTATLLGGAVASAAFFAVVWASYLYAMDIWLAELTDGEQGPEDPRRAGLWAAGITAPLLLGSVGTALLVASGGHGVLAATAAAYGVQVFVNLFDLLIIDIAIYMWVYPKTMQVEGVAPLHDYAHHARAAAVGLVVGVPMALIAGGVAWGVYG